MTLGRKHFLSVLGGKDWVGCGAGISAALPPAPNVLLGTLRHLSAPQCTPREGWASILEGASHCLPHLTLLLAGKAPLPPWKMNPPAGSLLGNQGPKWRADDAEGLGEQSPSLIQSDRQEQTWFTVWETWSCSSISRPRGDELACGRWGRKKVERAWVLAEFTGH